VVPSTELAGLTEVRDFMLSICYISDGRGWATLNEIAEMTGVHETHVSEILRYLRKTRYGRYIVDKRHRENVGTYEYRVKKRLLRLLSYPSVHDTFGNQHCPSSRT
jgi:transcription initiation factor IIE alpha subunit